MRNGQLLSTKPMPRGVSAPTPSEIARRAYDLAIESACSAMLAQGHLVDSIANARRLLETAREADLAALRDSVINPGAIPWWKK